MQIRIISVEHFTANFKVSQMRALRGQISAKNRSAQSAASSHCEQDSPVYVKNIITLHAGRVRTNIRIF